MSRWSEINKLRLEMDMLQAKVKWMYKRGYSFEEMSTRVCVPEKNIRVIITVLKRRKVV